MQARKAGRTATPGRAATTAGRATVGAGKVMKAKRAEPKA
jgi:hypothetical protein